MKYLETVVTFSEIPDEITLCINITNCPCNCKGCHSPHLAEDIGKQLDLESIDNLINSNHGITCVCFLGGDRDPKTIDKFARHIKEVGLNTGWYSGKETISTDIDVRNFDYIKVGPYIAEFGPLDSKTTNQKMWKVECCTIDGEESITLKDITEKFWK